MNITNFRDIGGITTRLGKIKEKRLLRSGELYQLIDGDIRILQDEYDLKLIIDLRSHIEASEHPDSEVAGTRYLHLDVMADLDNGNTSFARLLAQLDLANVDTHMKRVYRDIILDDHASQEYGNFMREIADLASGSALFHCFAGKDRTGLGAALLLDTLGASKDDIYADYMLTNTMRKDANAAICEGAAKQYNLSAEQTEALRQFLLVKEEYIDETYRVIEETYGSTEKYILKGLKVSPETLDKIRAGYVDS
jgi:Protein tyrosine/serine phosphatase